MEAAERHDNGYKFAWRLQQEDTIRSDMKRGLRSIRRQQLADLLATAPSHTSGRLSLRLSSGAGTNAAQSYSELQHYGWK